MTSSLPEKFLQSARLLLRDNLLEDALSRAYYAILHAARAVLLAEGVNVTSHGAVRRLFGQRYIGDIPDLDACSAFGKSPTDALKQAQLAKKVWLEAARAVGKPIPKPRYRPAIYQTGL